MKGVETLKTKREFDRVYRNGKSFHAPYFVIFYKPENQFRIGFVASKKVGKAVRRNRAKRLLKALFIQVAQEIRTGHYIFVAKPQMLEADYGQLQRSFLALLKRARLL